MNKEQIIKTLNNENLNKDAMGELLWLLDKDFYKEKPVSIEEFYSSKEFVAEKWPSIFPLWKQTLNELFPTPFNAPFNEVLISAAAGSGKCLAKDTPILMYDGTIKMVQDIQVGDQLMGPDSKPRNVLSTCVGTEQMYDIVPTRGGETWGCNESHILSLKCGWDKTDRGAKYHKDDVYNMSIKDYLKRGKSSRQILRLYRASVDFPNQQELEIDPYIYGLWLGDGSTRNPSLTSIDEELIDTWCNYANDNGYQIRIEEQENNKSKTYHCNHGNIGGKENKFRTFINESTETGHKRILHRYKTASREDRWKLLAGIIDTDGYKKPGVNTWEITSKYEDLAQDYAFIARSLGCRVSVKKKEKCQYNGKFYDAWRVIIGGDLRECPIKLERKKAEGEFKDGDPLKTSFKVIDKGVGDYYGFTIDGDHLFMLGDFTVTHNTVTATISILYDMYKLACLKDPCAYYQLAPGTMIIMAIFSATASTAKVNWNEITQGILACPWIMRRIKDRRGVERKIGPIVPVEVMPGVFVQTGSKFQHSMGKAIFDGLMDEAAFGGANMKDSQKSYNELSSRIKTRFSKWGNKGNTPGQLFLISSPKEAGDFMQYRIEETQKADAKLTKIMQNISTWDADPSKDSDDKFTVFIGNENKEPCIYEPEDEIPENEMDDLLYVPMRYYEDFKKDLLISIMNYGGITTTSDMALFKSPTLLNEAFVLNNPFCSDIIELPFNKLDKTLMDFCDMSHFSDLRHPEHNRFIHIDAAYSADTFDVYGLASGYCVLDEMTLAGNENPQEEDLFTKKDRSFFVDFAVGIKAPKGQEVNLGKVQDFIEYIIKHYNYPVASISADQFQSKQTLQNLENKGFHTDYISVDRTRDPYLFLRYLVHNRQIMLAKNEELKTELRRLRDDGKKVDHPINCFTSDTKIQLVDGRSVSINDLLLEQEYKQNWVYTFNEQTKKIEPKKIKHVFQSGITKNLVKVTLDNGEVITCTPEHRFMLRDGSYEEIQNLTPGTSLMPLYTRVADKGLKGYRLYYEPMEDKWHYEHRSFGNPDKINKIIHHCNYNKLDNTPTNLKPMTASEHRTIHNNSTMDYKQSGKSVSLYHERMRNTEEYKLRNEKISNKVREHNKQVFESLTEEEKQLKLNKIKEKTDFIIGLEQYFNVNYNKLSTKDRQHYGQKYIRILHPEIIENQNKKLSEAHKQGKFKKIQEVITQKRWITNGIDNKYIFKTEEIPNGYWAGRTLSEETKRKLKIANSHSNWTEEQKQAYSKLQSELTSNRIWITNGIEDKYILKDSIIPEGFKLGRCKVGKNHKIVSIEFITKPSKVYDLEIEDNHNFALSAGVIVHNSRKDIGDAVAGCIWNCANSNEIMNKGKIAQAVMGNNQQFSATETKSLEVVEFERLKERFSQGMFKGL